MTRRCPNCDGCTCRTSGEVAYPEQEHSRSFDGRESSDGIRPDLLDEIKRNRVHASSVSKRAFREGDVIYANRLLDRYRPDRQ